jgi:hypothetical protein
MRATAAEDAALDHLCHPERFDSARGVPLDRFLAKPASSNPLNLLKAETRRMARETVYAEEMCRRGISGHVWPRGSRRFVLSLAESAAERLALVRWMEGDAPAVALALEHLPIAVQRQYTKQFRDRIIKRAVRRLPEASHTRRACTEK